MSSILATTVNGAFDFLGNDAGYTALGLKEFRRVDGNSFEWEDLRQMRSSDLPALAVTNITGSNRVIAEPANIMWTFTVDLALLYQANANLKSSPSTTSEAALWVILDLLLARTARSSGLSGVCSTYDLNLTGVHPIKPGEDVRGVSVWAYTFRLALSRSRQA